MTLSDVAPLIDNFINGTTNPEQSKQLKELLRVRPDVQMEYFKRLDLHAMILFNLASDIDDPYLSNFSQRKDRARKHSLKRRSLVVTAVFAMTLLCGVAAYWVTSPTDEATITHLGEDVQFEDQPLVVNDRLSFGQEIRLKQGLVEMESASGVRLVLEGPALLVPLRSGIFKLYFGRLFAHVPPKAIGFVIETPSARIVDLGTEFGVVVNKTGETELHVLKGHVEAGLFSSDGHVVSTQRLATNEAVRIQKNTQNITNINPRTEYFAQNTDTADKPQVLVAHWRLNEEPGAIIAKDDSVNQLHLGLMPGAGVTPLAGIDGPSGFSSAAGPFSKQEYRLQRILSQTEAEKFDVTRFTIEMWARNPIYETSENQPILFHYRNTAIHAVSQFNLVDFGFGFLAATDSRYVSHLCPGRLEWKKDRWYHIVLTYDSNTSAPNDSIVTMTRTSQLETDPKFSHTFTDVEDITPFVANGNLIIGGSTIAEIPRHWGGEIDEVQFFNGIPKKYLTKRNRDYQK